MTAKHNAEYYHIYILHCQNGCYYTGYTTDIIRRYHEHLLGQASKYTRSFKPKSIAMCWKILGNKSTAMKVEHYIKCLSKKDKTRLIESPEALNKYFNSIVINTINLKEICD